MNLLEPTYAPIIVFILRALIHTMGTMRLIMMHSERQAWSFFFASLESLMFAYTAGLVLTNLDNIPNLAAYVLGFAVGGYISMTVESRVLNIYDTVVIISNKETAHHIAVALRDADFGVTETDGIGLRGEVEVLRIVVHQREVKQVIGIARAVKEDVFITVEQTLMIRSGWIHSKHIG